MSKYPLQHIVRFLEIKTIVINNIFSWIVEKQSKIEYFVESCRTKTQMLSEKKRLLDHFGQKQKQIK